MRNRSLEKQSRWWTKVAGFGIWTAIQLICMTLRIRSEREVDEDEYDLPTVMCIWHNRNFVCPYAWLSAARQREMGVITSASKDGALLEHIVKYYGIKSYRGSSHRRGATAFLESMASIKKGNSLTVTPDGPRGPVYTTPPGIIKRASVSGAPIVPVCVEYENCWRISKAWDKYCIPKPFSKVNILWKKPVAISANATDEELSQLAAELEILMRAGLPDFEPLTTTEQCK